MSAPVSQDVAAALANYWHGGAGPSHSALTRAFLGARLGDVAPNPGGTSADGPNKEGRVQLTVMAAVRRPDTARPLVDGLLSLLRTGRHFDRTRPDFDLDAFTTLAKAFSRQGWTLTPDGELMPVGEIDLQTGGREALDEQIARLRRNTDDPGALIGSTKDLLEATAKFILTELSVPFGEKFAFDELWHHVRDRLGILPVQIAQDVPGSKCIKSIVQSAWTIVEQVNVLRGLQGSGHGRTLPTGVTPEQALLVVREACSVAEFALASLDRQLGRR